MGKTGYPYDNAPRRKVLQHAKNRPNLPAPLSYWKELYDAIEEFAYVHYNLGKPHAYNNY